MARIRSILRWIKWSPARSSERRLAAIVAFDLDFTRFVHDDEAGTLAALDRIFAGGGRPASSNGHGVLFMMLGDGVLVELAAVDAMEWAVEFQKTMAGRDEACRRVAA